MKLRHEDNLVLRTGEHCLGALEMSSCRSDEQPSSCGSDNHTDEGLKEVTDMGTIYGKIV